MLKSALFLALLSVVVKILGFGREVALSYTFGTTLISDAYILAIAIPGLFFTILSSAINAVYIPFSNRFDNAVDKVQLTNRLINIFSVLILFVIFLVIIFSTELIRLYTGGVNDDLSRVAEGMLELTAFTLLVRILIVILNSYLQINDKYLSTNLIGLPLNIIIIISILLSSEQNYELLATGFTFAMYSQLIVVIPFLVQCKYKYNFKVAKSDKFNILAFSKLMSFVMAAAFVNQLNTIVDLRVGLSLGEGVVSSINYALKLQILIQMIFVTSLSIVFFPKMASLYKNKANATGLLNQSIKIIVFFITPISVFTFLESEAVIALVYGYGQFDLNSIEQTAIALKYYSVGFLAFGVRELLIKDYYASNSMKKPIVFICISTIANIALTLILANYYGIKGVALATSITAYILIALLLFDIYRVKRECILKTQYVDFAKCIASAYVSYCLLKVFCIPSFVLEGLVFILLYSAIGFSLKIKL